MLHSLVSTFSPSIQVSDRQERIRVVTPPPQLRLHRLHPLHKLQPITSIPSIETEAKITPVKKNYRKSKKLLKAENENKLYEKIHN